MPKRIQRKRTKGWRMPSNTVYVGRPTKWGNPFVLEGDMIYCDASHRRTVMDPWVVYDNDNLYSKENGLRRLLDLFRNWLAAMLPADDYENRGKVVPPKIDVDMIKTELKGKDLACWCPEGQPCHADVLLEIANN